jgi:hypothetical protein
MVFLASDEWDTGDVMRDVARETFAAYPIADCVEVHEHAGWHLTFNRAMQIVGTANDCAGITPAMREFWKDVWAVDWLAIIRRDSGLDEKTGDPACCVVVAASCAESGVSP